MSEQSYPIFNKEIDRLHMNISEVCYAKLDKGWRYRDHKPVFTRIYAVTKGEGIITCRGQKIEMRPGNIYILPTGTEMEYHCTEYLEKLYFHVNLLQYNNRDMLSTMKQPAVIPYKNEDILQALYLFERNDMYAVVRLKAWIWEVIAMGMEISGTDFSPIPKYSPLTEQVILYVDNHLRSGLSVGEIAAALYTSPGRLQKIFRREMDIPLGRYITDKLFFEAEKQLRTTNSTIKEISVGLGFCDPFYFSRMYTKHHGIPPSKYRKQLDAQDNVL